MESATASNAALVARAELASGEYIDFVLYRYDPSAVLAWIFAVLFFLTTALHALHTIKLRAWYWIPFLLGGTFQFLGYIGRYISSTAPSSTGPYIMQTLLLLIAPALYAASIYMLLSRLMRLLAAPHLSPIPVRFLTKLFVAGDVLSFMMQGAGGGIMSQGTLAGMETGEKIVIGGLFVQIAFFSFFLVAMSVFLRRYNRTGAPAPADRTVPGEGWGARLLNGRVTTNWKVLLAVMYGASVLILVRSIFRVVEYVQGNDGYLMSHEVFLYVFDAVLMLLAMVGFNVSYPGSVVDVREIQDSKAAGSVGGGEGSDTWEEEGAVVLESRGGESEREREVKGMV